MSIPLDTFDKTVDSTSSPIEDKELSKDDVFNFISEEGEAEVGLGDRTSPKKIDNIDTDKEESEDNKEDDKEEEDDELAELEADLEEDEEPSKDKLELVTPVRRRDILKKFPTLFKDFPYLEKAYYREQQFTKYFPDPNDAKEAHERSQTLANFEKDIIEDGNTVNILKLIKDNNPAKFAEVCDNYLDNLARIDNSAYQHVLGNVIKQTIAAMYEEGKEQDNDVMKQAAVVLNQYAFGSSKYKPPTKLAKTDTNDAEVKAKAETSKRERELVKVAFDNASNDVSSRINNYFKANIEANIDPKKSMSDYVRKNATKDAIEKIQDLISRDTRFKTLTDKLWEQAIRANFSKDSTDKIKKAFIARGKSLLAPVVKSARNEAMRGLGRVNSKADKDEVEDIDTDKESKPSRKTAEGEPRLSSNKSKAKEIPKGMSSFDYLMKD